MIVVPKTTKFTEREVQLGDIYQHDGNYLLITRVIAAGPIGQQYDVLICCDKDNVMRNQRISHQLLLNAAYLGHMCYVEVEK